MPIVPPVFIDSADRPPCVEHPELIPRQTPERDAFHNESMDIYDQCRQLIRAHDYRDAERLSKQLLTRQQVLLGKDCPESVDTLNVIADAAEQSDDHASAEEALRQLIALKVRYLGVEGSDTGAAVEKLFEFLVRSRRTQEAYNVVAQFADQSEQHHPALGAQAQYLCLRARSLEAIGHYREAAAMAKQACDVKRRFPAAFGAFPKIYQLLLVQARTEIEAGEYDNAYEILADAHRLSYAKHQAEDPQYIECLQAIAREWKAKGNMKGAEKCVRLAADIAQYDRSIVDRQ